MNSLSDGEKIFGKIQYSFMVKVLERLWMKGKYLSTIKEVYRKLIVNIKINKEKHKAIPLKSETK